MDRLIRACYDSDSDDLGAFRDRLLGELRRVVAYDAAFFATADPATLLFTSAYADEPLVDAAPRFLDNEFGAGPDVNRFSSLAHAADPTGSLDAATDGQRRDSARWQEILDPLGMGDEARAALRVDGTTWGFLCLHRSGPSGFSPTELTVLRQAAPHLGAALRRHVTRAGGEPEEQEDAHGIVVVDRGRIVALGGSADRWLHELTGAHLRPGDEAPLVLLSLVRRLEAVEGGQRPTPAAARVPTPSGALVAAQATRLDEGARSLAVAITFAPATPAERQSLLISAHGLTPAQARVAELVLQGLTTRQVVQELHISEHTVQDHLKAVFDKVGVRSRRELVAALMTRR